MSDLFAEDTSLIPLSDRLRPKTLDEVIGQQHLVGPLGPIRLMVENKQIQSMILWGPPGVGKTTLARILAQNSGATFIAISAVLAGMKEIRGAIEKAEESRRLGRQCIVFVDEVHRFNKAQQDAFLPHVESGMITLIGATTENPSFEVNSALLSRATVYVLHPLTTEDLEQLVTKILSLPEYQGITLDKTAQAMVIAFADGDARRLINSMEQLLNTARAGNKTHLDEKFCGQILGDKTRRFDKGGEQFYDLISALHKSVRGSHPNASLYWFCRMLDGGSDPRYLARRIIRMAWEDIGLADPRAAEIALNAAETYERLGSPEGELALAAAVVFMATAAKSNAVYRAYNEARRFVRTGQTASVPLHLRNAPTKLMKDLNYGKSYRYAHDEPNAYAAGETYMPEGLREVDWYQPVDRGLEIKIKEKLAALRTLDENAKKKR